MNQMVEVDIKDSANFQLIQETLTRVGKRCPSLDFLGKTYKVLIPCCYIFHKEQRYYIVHYKEMFLLDGEAVTMTPEDYHDRDSVIDLLERWNMCERYDELRIDGRSSSIVEKFLKYLILFHIQLKLKL